MDTTYEFIAPGEGEAGRLDQFVARSVEGMTRSTVQRLIDEGRVTVDGKVEKPSLKLRGGERIVVAVPPPAPAVPEAEEIPLVILHEDSDLVVVNKSAGMVVHPGAGTPGGTLVNALLAHCTDLSGIGGEIRPGIVHRIDKDTTGVLVVAKNDRSHEGLARQFREHTIKRIYLALVFGSPKTDTGRIEGAIGRHPTDRLRMSGKAKHGKHAVTHWKVLARYPGMTLLRLRLETGRTHQIRVHLAESGHPLVGDEVYGGAGRANDLRDPVLKKLVRELGRQALHAKTLGFIHPASGSYVEFDTELPDDMARIITYLEQQGA
ncbi:pseudouridine synthase, RluA family [Geobacter metallireducens RCH3]|uniref:Pseudouridine synthase n=1 Tax=Geobacter metallireducens (strain ATCC 53774 / DSM 7210 / GS-15) TaxID=269799 RepID=Q39Q27_GEOMG|nr:RluA family pseudouridine synthase [Geobacter metallireducens]ABB33647.1 23S rRNA pseudouridines 1911, 1915, 1917 synthase [Geobacter metallireducens GS-15]EHP84072.1 pseudouridine synthase, RluA family [Geobacter metallireducens RCH3]